MIVPLDPAERERYIMESVHIDEEVDHIYKLTMQDEDWINPTADAMLCWENDSDCFSDFDGEMENWKNRLHDMSAL